MSSIAALALVAALAIPPAGDNVFVRDLRTIDDVVRAIHLRASTENHARLVFCLDDALFEKSRWFAAIEKEFRDPAFDIVITGRSEPAKRLAHPGLPAKPSHRHVSNDDFGLLPDQSFHDRTPVGDWTQSVTGFAKRGAAVVFISSQSPAESWAPPDGKSDLDACLDPCWHEEEVGARFAAAGVSLWIVAPEAPFSCDAAVTLCRLLPFANRPTFFAGRHFATWITQPVLPTPGQTVSPEQLEAMKSRRVPYPRFKGSLPGLIKFDVEADSRAETDVPSGSGYWSYARSCFMSQGHYLVFAEGHDEFLDPCERSPTLSSLAPPLDRSAKEQWAAIATTDPVKQLHDIVADALAASRDLFEIVRPRRRSGGEEGGRLHDSIDPFEAAGIPRSTLVNLGFDEKDCREWQNFSKTLAAPIAAQDRAALQLSRSLEQCSAAWDSVGPRARNDALVERFWLKMSAFHLESLRVLTADPEHFLIHAKKGWRYHAGAVEAIELSDCLEAYDGRRIAADVEEASAKLRVQIHSDDETPQVDQGNLLVIRQNPQALDPNWQPAHDGIISLGGVFDPSWRAQRDDLAPVANLDPQLKTRALDLIASAREIHDSLRGTPWDWLVYYAEIDVYVFLVPGHPPGDSRTPRPSQNPDDDGPATPKAPPRGSTPGAKPGSTGGGN